jgi:hypothetical protein
VEAKLEEDWQRAGGKLAKIFRIKNQREKRTIERKRKKERENKKQYKVELWLLFCCYSSRHRRGC